MFACWCANEACQIYGCMRAREKYNWKPVQPEYYPLPITEELRAIKKAIENLEQKYAELIKVEKPKAPNE